MPLDKHNLIRLSCSLDNVTSSWHIYDIWTCLLTNYSTCSACIMVLLLYIIYFCNQVHPPLLCKWWYVDMHAKALVQGLGTSFCADMLPTQFFAWHYWICSISLKWLLHCYTMKWKVITILFKLCLHHLMLKHIYSMIQF